MRIVQILDYSGLYQTASTVVVAEWTHSAAIFISFVMIRRPPSRFANGNPSKSPFQRPSPTFRPVYQTYLPLCPAQNTLESDGGMAVIPVFNHSSNIPAPLVKPILTIRPGTDISIALPTPSPTGLYAPMTQNVSARSIHSLTSTLKRFSHLGRQVSYSLTPLRCRSEAERSPHPTPVRSEMGISLILSWYLKVGLRLWLSDKRSGYET